MLITGPAQDRSSLLERLLTADYQNANKRVERPYWLVDEVVGGDGNIVQFMECNSSTSGATAGVEFDGIILAVDAVDQLEEELNRLLVPPPVRETRSLPICIVFTQVPELNWQDVGRVYQILCKTKKKHRPYAIWCPPRIWAMNGPVCRLISMIGQRRSGSGKK